LARCLIIGCGCRGQMLARALVKQGYAVRGTTRDPGRRPEIEEAGAECVVADPDRLGSLIGALEHVTVAVILLGSAQGEPEALAELHGPRLEALARRMIDTTIHGVIYEARGAVDPALLGQGAELVRAFGARSRARVELLEADPKDPEAWLAETLAAVRAVMGDR
jgi:uncharacterized protein YbjT (DUF2867 family)